MCLYAKFRRWRPFVGQLTGLLNADILVKQPKSITYQGVPSLRLVHAELLGEAGILEVSARKFYYLTRKRARLYFSRAIPLPGLLPVVPDPLNSR